jgi:uncharacterized protein YuzE
VYINDAVEPGLVKKTSGCDPIEAGGMIDLDFDDEGAGFVGVEVLDASRRLPKTALKKAIRI